MSWTLKTAFPSTPCPSPISHQPLSLFLFRMLILNEHADDSFLPFFEENSFVVNGSNDNSHIHTPIAVAVVIAVAML